MGEQGSCGGWATTQVLGREKGKTMRSNPLNELGTLGQSIWLDYIQRDLITSGGLRRLIKEDGLRGMTSNPSLSRS
jgi:hypothetical protein